MNQVILLGNLTRDPELKYLPSSTPVVNFGMAMNERWTDQQTGEQKESVCFVEVEGWNRQAEVVNEYFKKGSQILIQGSLKFESWEVDGQTRSRLKVRMQRFEFVGARQDSDASANGNGTTANGNNANNANQNGNGNARPNPATAAPAPTTSTTDTGDEVPF